jgi:hypothetical protein
MSAYNEKSINQLLKQAVPPVDADAEPPRDLWPAVLRKLDERAPDDVAARSHWVWFDVALLGGLAVLGVSFPATIPLLLYYL